MFQVPTFLLLCCSSDLSGEPEIKSWSAIFRTHKFPREWIRNQTHFLQSCSILVLSFSWKSKEASSRSSFSSSSVSAAADVSERDVLESKEASSRSSFSSSSCVSAADDVFSFGKDV
jgi:hypothetical protein